MGWTTYFYGSDGNQKSIIKSIDHTDRKWLQKSRFTYMCKPSFTIKDGLHILRRPLEHHSATLIGSLSVISRVKKMYGASDLAPLINGSLRKDSGNLFLFNLKRRDCGYLSK